MAYEYEEENKEAAMINPPKANKEMQEIYRKAKAFDEIMKGELEAYYDKAKAFDEIYKFLSNSPIEPFFKEYLERMANELEDNNND